MGQDINERLGKCYEFSARFVVSHPEWKLVHGIIKDNHLGTGGILGHAWCEKDDIAYDAVLDQKFPKRAYYDFVGVIDYKTHPYEKIQKIAETYKVYYTAKEAMEQMDITENYGPWDDFLLNHKDKPGKSAKKKWSRR